MKKILLIALCALIVSCVRAPTKAVPAQTVKISCNVPVITHLPQTKELQSKGGINISLAIDTFKCADIVQESIQELKPTFGDEMDLSLSGVPEANQPMYKLVEIQKTPGYQVTPNRLAFRVKINNQMDRVFRGSGTVVLYDVSGKNTSVNAQDYAELTNVIVPPRKETEVTIYGPAITDLPNTTTLGLFLYDVTIKTDKAGNIVEKQNFEWYYNYQLVSQKENSVEVVKTKKWVMR